MHDRFNNWLATVLLVVGLGCFVALFAHIVIATRAIRAELTKLEADRASERNADVMPANAILNPGPYPDEQRTWADLFAACRFSDAWLGSDIDGEPICYPMHQTERVVP